MRKFIKVTIISVLALLMIFTIAACNPKGGGNTPPDNNKKLTPDSIVKLKDIEDYGVDKYTKIAAVSYTDTESQKGKLETRINQKKQDLDNGEDLSSATKIFANSNANKIIEQMSKAALSYEKMTATVDYLAGSTDVTAEMIDSRVSQVQEQQAKFENTPDSWSLFDDWDYYDKLQSKSDDLNADVNASEAIKNNAEDNVKRQERNIMRKIFALGLDGAEFGKLATYELAYATTVVEGANMANTTISTDTNLTSFDTYCKNNLDYETLVYLRAFNKYYNNGNSLNNCVRLYGYYYEYNRTSYNSQNDTDFEKQLTYGHKKTFTESEWLDYVRIQRNSYVNAYRYADNFYVEKFYPTHLQFQEIVEAQEIVVYAFSPANWQGVGYTGEMRKAIQNNGLNGQLKMSDWIWCYAGDDAVMKEYNSANTDYENGKDQTKAIGHGTSDAEYDGKFKFEMQQLKAVDYLMTNMSKTELGQALYFEVYSYSGEIVKAAQGYRKDQILLRNGKKEADSFDYAHIAASVAAADKVDYVYGKIGAILDQMASTYKGQNVSNKAQKAAEQPWDTMHQEVQAAMNHNYTGTAKEKAEALEDMVIKRNWSCGAAIDDDNCPNHPGLCHVDCTKEYAKDHQISQFASNYQVIIRYMVGQSEMSFNRLNETKGYTLPVYVPQTTGEGYTVNVGFAGLKTATTALGVEKIEFPDKSSYIESKSFNVNAGKVFISDISGDDLTWWNGNGTSVSGSKPAKANTTAREATAGNTSQQIDYTYVYAFSAWYLDEDLEYAFDPNDKIGCDLALYAGYNVTKRS